MTDGELKFPKWQALLQDFILEFDREKLPEEEGPDFTNLCRCVW